MKTRIVKNMIRLVSVTMCVGFILAVAPRLRAQDCHLWTNWDLRGTYTVAGTGWIEGRGQELAGGIQPPGLCAGVYL